MRVSRRTCAFETCQAASKKYHKKAVATKGNKKYKNYADVWVVVAVAVRPQSLPLCPLSLKTLKVSIKAMLQKLRAKKKRKANQKTLATNLTHDFHNLEWRNMQISMVTECQVISNYSTFFLILSLGRLNFIYIPKRNITIEGSFCNLKIN